MKPRKVVFAPDIVISALFDPRAREIVNRWRDGEIVPVVTRDLLVIYLRILGQAGLNASLLHQWSLWLTTPGRAIFINQGDQVDAEKGPFWTSIAAAHGAEVLTLR